MSDSYQNQTNNERDFPNSRTGARNGFRGGRPSGNREGGGFRIRLSDNEMRAARALQEAFNLKSTVAVLGFALRTLAQMLEEGKLEEFLKQYQTQSKSSASRREGYKNNRYEETNQNQENRGTKPNPFARPEKPQSLSTSQEEIDSADAEDLESEEESLLEGKELTSNEEVNSSTTES